MKILCLCKASINDGLGHLLRSITFCDRIKSSRPQLELSLFLISDLELDHLAEKKHFNYEVFDVFPTDRILEKFDIIFLDLLHLNIDEINLLKSHSRKVVSLSPIFNQMKECDTLITRTKYLGNSESTLPKQVLAGLDYAIIRNDIRKINPDQYIHNLNRKSLHIGISLGGTDPNNNTLKVIQQLKIIDLPVVFWVLLGEGYKYQYDKLAAEIKGHKTHEMILARTNKNMWEVLENCNMAILAGGLTSYEAAYAGLPAINFFSKPNRSYLVQELEENGLSINSCFKFKDLPNILLEAIDNKEMLIEVNSNSQKFLPFSDSILNEFLRL